MACIDPATALLYQIKRPGETRNYSIDFVKLIADGGSIASLTSITALPAGLTISNTAFSGTQASADISGGTDGVDYEVTAIVVDSQGNILEDDVMIKVRKAGLL